jgi:cytochrome c-type biogenesis protein CcmH/NrfG
MLGSFSWRLAMKLFLCVSVALFCSIQTASAEDRPLILTGKVQMEDGSPPPKPVGIQRICSDSQGKPGPITDKKGNWLWRLEVDPMRSRVCRLEATLPGYASSSIDISALNGFTGTTKELPPLILVPTAPNPMTIVPGETGVPGKSLNAWRAAIKAIQAVNIPEAESQLQAAVQASPKFAQGWHTLAIVYSTDQKGKEAKDAWEHAIAADPKLLQPYVALARLCVRTKDWQCTLTAADGLLKVDKKQTFPEIYIHQAVALYSTKDLAGAQAAAENAMKLDLVHKRSEYILGRILEAQGDLAGAKEHMAKYVERDPNVADIQLVKKHLELLGKPEAAGAEPELSVL